MPLRGWRVGLRQREDLKLCLSLPPISLGANFLQHPVYFLLPWKKIQGPRVGGGDKLWPLSGPTLCYRLTRSEPLASLHAPILVQVFPMSLV